MGQHVGSMTVIDFIIPILQVVLTLYLKF